MEFAQFEDWFSTARVNRYWKATNSSGKQAMNLYKANIEVSKAFYPLLSIFEIILRNKMDAVLSAAISEDWIYLVKDGRFGTQIPFKNVNDVFNKLPRPIAPTKDRIISELTFGFWTSLFETTNYKHFKGTPIKVFSPLPSGYGRKEIHKKLNGIRILRNRIYHNESICFNKYFVDFSICQNIHADIVELLGYIDPQIYTFICDLDTVSDSIVNATEL